MRRFILASLSSLVSLSGFSVSLQAQGWILPRPCVIRVLPADRAPVQTCQPTIVRSHSDVRVELTYRVLHYDVEERYVNRGAMIGEADYYFPLPPNAAFQSLSLSIDGELVAGETMDAAKARGIYESIVRARRDPALVEWMGSGLLHARIFPINPGEEKRVVVRFQTVAQREGDALRVDYNRGSTAAPTATGASGVTGNRPDGMTSSFTLTYHVSPDLGTPYSPTHSVDIADHDGRREVTVRGDAGNLTLLVPVRRNGATSISMLPYAPGNEDGFALITISPPAAQRAEATPRDVTLVLDVSGSMQGRKIEQARAAARQLLGTLRPEDRFRLIDFSSDVHTFKDDFVSASADNVREANPYIDALDADGGTNIEGALREAMRPRTIAGRLPLVLFVTDGEPTVGDGNPDHLAAIAAGGIEPGGVRRRIFTFGLGSDVNVSLLEQLALEGRGTSQFVRPDESVERMMGIVANRLVDPIMTDVRVHVDGGVKLSKILPAAPMDAFADRDLVVLGRYSGHGPARIVVDGIRSGAPAQWTANVDFPDRDRQNPFVARIWATQRVGYLSAEARKSGVHSPEVDDEIKALGEQYGIPTEFTSYLVTEPQVVGMHVAALSRRMIIGGAPATAPAPAAPTAPAADVAFEAARVASAQRAAKSTAVLDSLTRANSVDAKGIVSTRQVGGHTFHWHDGVWTDARFRPGMNTVVIKPYSPAYFDLIAALPDLRAVFAIGDRLIVVGRARAIELSERGAEALSASAIAALESGW